MAIYRTSHYYTLYFFLSLFFTVAQQTTIHLFCEISCGGYTSEGFIHQPQSDTCYSISDITAGVGCSIRSLYVEEVQSECSGAYLQFSSLPRSLFSFSLLFPASLPIFPLSLLVLFYHFSLSHSPKQACPPCPPPALHLISGVLRYLHSIQHTSRRNPITDR